MKRTLRSIIMFVLLVPVFSLPLILRAEDRFPGEGVSGTFQNPLGGASTFSALLDRLLSVLLQVGLVVVVVAFVYVGYKFVMARGSEKEVTEARSAFYWTVIGAAVLLGAKVIQTAISGTVRQLGS